MNSVLSERTNQSGPTPATGVDLPAGLLINKTLDYSDLDQPAFASTATDLRKWVWKWLFAGQPLGVNGSVKRRWYVRRHKMWEYTRGLALSGTSRPTRKPGQKFTVLDVGGAMTMPVFYLASLGDKVVCLDIHEKMTRQTNEIAKRRKLDVTARTDNLVTTEVKAEDLGVPGGFDRVYCFCVIEHVVPPGQAILARRMASLLKPGGLLYLSFDYGENAPTEAPMYSMAHVDAIRDAIGLPLVGNQTLADDGKRLPLNRRYPGKPYTFGCMLFKKPG